jgi:hypothetical protein
MATKTFKIGEYAKGGIITVETTAKQVTVIGKDWDFSKGSRRSSDQSGAKEWTRETVSVLDSQACRKLDNFLNDLTTSYYAGLVLDWIKSKVKLDVRNGGFYY